MVTGDHPLMTELETRLARLKGSEAALVFGSGFLANIGIIPCFAGPEDVIFMDELCHACLYAGARLSRASVFVFRHNDMAHLGEIGRASCRARVCQSVLLSVVAVSFKNKCSTMIFIT